MQRTAWAAFSNQSNMVPKESWHSRITHLFTPLFITLLKHGASPWNPIQVSWSTVIVSVALGNKVCTCISGALIYKDDVRISQKSEGFGIGTFPKFLEMTTFRQPSPKAHFCMVLLGLRGFCCFPPTMKSAKRPRSLSFKSGAELRKEPIVRGRRT